MGPAAAGKVNYEDHFGGVHPNAIENPYQEMLIQMLMRVLGFACEMTGMSPEKLKETLEAYPFATMFTVLIGLVFLCDVIVPILWFPIKQLNDSAQRRAVAHKEAEAQTPGSGRKVR